MMPQPPTPPTAADMAAIFTGPVEGRDYDEMPKPKELLTPAQVARLFGVSTKTVQRWEMAGKLSSVKTLGGHRRYYADEVRALLAGAK